jgi:hypothetical protein
MAPSNKPRISQMRTFPAATAGWISNQNLAAPRSSPQGAAVLENVFPTATGGEVRRGSAIYATLEDETKPVTALFSYNNGNNKKLFAANDEKIYDITVITSPVNYRLVDDDGNYIVDDLGNFLGESSTGELDVVVGQTGGNWIVTQFATTGGVYLVAVNGEDEMQLYDGTTWYPINGEAINSLNYDAETLPFTAGATLTGGTSGATATIIRVTDNGTTGTLLIGNVTGGPFQNNEIISGGGGSATADGTISTLFVAVTGIATSSLSYVWSYKNRLFFIEKDSMNAWYLPIDAIGGALTKFPMGGVFPSGGSLLFGASWSLDSSGDGGLSEQCIFVTTEGEVAVYQGDNPSTAATWSKVGTYRIGKPLGPQAWIRAGGDLVIATDIGAVPLSQAIQRDYAALSPSAVSFPIETAWNEAVALRRSENWHCVVWPERQMVVVSIPTVNEQPPAMYVANARTGAWANFTGWSGTCLEVFNGRMFFGSQSGKVIEAYVTGLDEGSTYTAVYVPLFTDLGNSGALKIAEIARLVTRSAQDINPQLSVMLDYVVDLPASPSAAPIAAGSEWDVGVWDVSVWGQETAKKIQQNWTSVGGVGYALAPAAQITSGSIIPLDCELIRLELTYDTADIVS